LVTIDAPAFAVDDGHGVAAAGVANGERFGGWEWKHEIVSNKFERKR
jgi:hypothetical protein